MVDSQKRKKLRSAPEVEDVANLIGAFIEHWGFKKVQGMSWAYLFLLGRPLCATELSDLLGVSRALVSMTLNELLRFEVIFSERSEGNKQIYYRHNPAVANVVSRVIRARERRLLARLSAATQSLSQLPAQAHEKDADAAFCPRRAAELVEAVQTVLATLDEALRMATVEAGLFSRFNSMGVEQAQRPPAR